MRALKVTVVVIAMSAALAAAPGWAQTPAGQATPPAGQQPAAPAGEQQPAPQPQPPQPFPEGAKIAYVDVQVIASSSAEGKAATARIQELQKKKTAELGEKQKALQALQTKLTQGGTVISDSARNQLEKDIEKLNRELQFLQQDAQAEIQQLQQDLQQEFQTKLQPVIDQVAKERGLHYVFSIRDSGAIWANTGLDLSAEIVKRFDAAAKAPAKK
jgi:outer membrane protein